jgi:hypothetical protein
MFKIWSIEHNAWWKPAERGYTKFRKKAGIYTFEKALEIVRGANIGLKDEPNEAMVEVLPEELNHTNEDEDAENL